MKHKVTLVKVPSKWICNSCNKESIGRGAIVWAICGYCPYCKNKDIQVVQE